MIRRSFRIGLMLGVFAGLAFAVAKVLGSRQEETHALAGSGEPWPRLSVPDPPPPAHLVAAPVEPEPEPTPAPAPAAAKPAPAKKKAPAPAWVEPTDGVCPTSHPVKGKLASKIFHLPGMLNYERTKPDRCYVDAGTAEADGLRAAKR